ncbi:hypothetical protein RQP46_006884 [Phenoliferia psychrophenolica]
MRGLQLPPLQAFSFIPPIFLQCILLHPSFPDLLGILAGIGVWRALEWGFVADRTPYTWIGLDADDSAAVRKSDDAAPPSLPIRKDRARLEAIRRKSAETDTAVDIVRNSLHLAMSVRGTGYVFGPPGRLDKGAGESSVGEFVKHYLVELARGHAIVLPCAMYLSKDPSYTRQIIASLLPWAPKALITGIHTFVTTSFMGFGISMLLPKSLQFLPPFDPKAWHPFFGSPWRSDSVSLFWRRWHWTFRHSFKVLGGDWVCYIVTNKNVAMRISIMGAFALSAWIHEQALYSARYTLPPPNPPLSFVERWGGTIWFLLQGLAINLEMSFTAATGRRVGGTLGRVWGFFWLAVCGVLVQRTALGLLTCFPNFQAWTWPRFVFPMLCVAPAPFFTK